MIPKIHPAAKCKTAPVEGTAVVWTVWTKSSMTFQGTDGFTVYDHQGTLRFRVDNYFRKHRCLTGEIVLMEGSGRPLFFLRPQILSMHNRWNGYKEGDASHFSMRRHSILQAGDSAEIFMNGSSLGQQQPKPDYQFMGCFQRRCCKVTRASTGEVVATISRKKAANTSVMLDNDVFTLTVEPGADSELIMAFVIIMDRICHRPYYTPSICSA